MSESEFSQERPFYQIGMSDTTLFQNSMFNILSCLSSSCSFFKITILPLSCSLAQREQLTLAQRERETETEMAGHGQAKGR